MILLLWSGMSLLDSCKPPKHEAVYQLHARDVISLDCSRELNIEVQAEPFNLFSVRQWGCVCGACLHQSWQLVSPQAYLYSCCVVETDRDAGRIKTSFQHQDELITCKQTHLKVLHGGAHGQDRTQAHEPGLVPKGTCPSCIRMQRSWKMQQIPAECLLSNLVCNWLRS
jgi:ubiquitin